MSQLHIALDLDGVVLDFVGGICTAIKKEYDVELTPADVTEWDLGPLLNPIIGHSWWKWLEERNWLWSSFPAVDGAIGAIDTLRRDGHHIEIVTAKPVWAEYAVWRWLGKWRPPVHAVTIVDVGQSKGQATDADLLVDDNVGNCVDFLEHGGDSLLFSTPYNTDAILPVPVKRCDGWRDVLAQIQKESALV